VPLPSSMVSSSWPVIARLEARERLNFVYD